MAQIRDNAQRYAVYNHELITEKGQRTLAALDLVPYVGSLAPGAFLAWEPKRAERISSAIMALDEIVRIMAVAYAARAADMDHDVGTTACRNGGYAAVFIGNSSKRTLGDFVFTPRGYGQKYAIDGRMG